MSFGVKVLIGTIVGFLVAAWAWIARVRTSYRRHGEPGERPGETQTW